MLLVNTLQKVSCNDIIMTSLVVALPYDIIDNGTYT